MKPTDPTPEEYTKWIMESIKPYIHEDFNFVDNGLLRRSKEVAKFQLTELRDNSTTELNKLYFNECLTKLKKL